MPVRHNEQVPLADREAVPAGIAEIVLRYDLISTGVAERAFHRFHDENIWIVIRYGFFHVPVGNRETDIASHIDMAATHRV